MFLNHSVCGMHEESATRTNSNGIHSVCGMHEESATRTNSNDIHFICGILDRESNPLPLAYGNTASTKGTITTKPNPLLQK
jgi:hypothetical protein